jgi:hypothetical protein
MAQYINHFDKLEASARVMAREQLTLPTSRDML